MSDAINNELFCIDTWERFNAKLIKVGASDPNYSIELGEKWSDGALMISRLLLQPRPANPGVRHGAFGEEVLRLAMKQAEALLPCSLPAVVCYLPPDGLRQAQRGAVLCDQAGRRAWVRYGYLSILRCLCPEVELRILSRNLFSSPLTPVVFLAHSGKLVGMLVQVYPPWNPRYEDGPIATGIPYASKKSVDSAVLAGTRMRTLTKKAVSRCH